MLCHSHENTFDAPRKETDLVEADVHLKMFPRCFFYAFPGKRTGSHIYYLRKLEAIFSKYYCADVWRIQFINSSRKFSSIYARDMGRRAALVYIELYIIFMLLCCDSYTYMYAIYI